MEIKIFKKEKKVLLTIDKEEPQEFNFDTLDCLIDRIVENNDEININCDNNDLNNYKILLDNLVDETQTDDFKNAFKHVKEETNINDLEEELKNNCSK